MALHDLLFRVEVVAAAVVHLLAVDADLEPQCGPVAEPVMEPHHCPVQVDDRPYQDRLKLDKLPHQLWLVPSEERVLRQERLQNGLRRDDFESLALDQPLHQSLIDSREGVGQDHPVDQPRSDLQLLQVLLREDRRVNEGGSSIDPENDTLNSVVDGRVRQGSDPEEWRYEVVFRFDV